MKALARLWVVAVFVLTLPFGLAFGQPTDQARIRAQALAADKHAKTAVTCQAWAGLSVTFSESTRNEGFEVYLRGPIMRGAAIIRDATASFKALNEAEVGETLAAPTVTVSAATNKPDANNYSPAAVATYVVLRHGGKAAEDSEVLQPSDETFGEAVWHNALGATFTGDNATARFSADAFRALAAAGDVKVIIVTASGVKTSCTIKSAEALLVQ